MKRNFSAGIAVMLLIGAVATLSYLAGKNSNIPDYAIYIQRHKMILKEAALRSPRGGTLLIGDSLSQRSGLVTACGRQVFNAGITAAQLHEVASFGVDLANILRPTRIIIAIGTNDSIRTIRTDTDRWAKSYAGLLDQLKGYPIELVGMPAVQPGMRLSDQMDNSDLAVKNAALRQIANDRGLSLAPPLNLDTVDGVHPTPAATFRWRENVTAHCPLSTPAV